jgi:hypothetical protein
MSSRDEVHFDQELAGLPGKEKPRQAVGVGIKLPVDEVLLGSDAKRIVENRGSRMKCGAQLDDLWPEGYRLVVPIGSPVMQRNLYSHPPSCCARL